MTAYNDDEFFFFSRRPGLSPQLRRFLFGWCLLLAAIGGLLWWLL